MRKNIKNIDALVKKVIEESLQEKADELTKKVKTKMDEWTPNAPVTLSGTGDYMHEEDDVDMEIESRLCDEDSDEYDEERCSYNRKAKMGREDELEEVSTKDLVKGKKYKYKSPSFEDEIEYEDKVEYPEGKPMYGFKGKKAHHSMGDTHIEDFLSDIDEQLIGGQKKLDKNKNGKLDSQDFKMLRGDVEEGFSDFFDDDYEGIHNYLSGDDSERFHPLSDEGERDTAMSRMRRGKGDIEDIDFDEMDEEVEEGNAFTGALAKTKKGDKFNLGGKSYTDRSNLEEVERLIQKVYEGVKRKKKIVKESFQLTESEMVDLIEKIVMEQKKAKGMAETEKVQKVSKKENEDAIKAVTKKMKEYLKDGSKGEYSMEPKTFPKGNGELAKMDKMAYQANKPTDEYIENFTAAGLENLVYDEIHPDEKWVDDNIEGSSRTGNNPEWANAVDDGVNKKRNKIRKDNLLGAVKAIAYNKAPQPVTDDTKSGPAGKFQKNFGKDSGKKATKILNQLESKENKSEKLISEEFDKIKHLMGYNKNTQ